MNAWSGRRALVTGAKGFMGSALVRRLVELGAAVTAIDVDVMDVRGIGRLDLAADAVFHLAAMTREQCFEKDPSGSFDVNVTGTQAVLNYCLKHRSRCVFLSTSGVYQPSEGMEKITEDHPVGPTRPYAVSKFLAESLCRRHCEDMGGTVTALRVFNVYGPGQAEPFLVPYILGSLRRSEPLALRMPGAVRDFIHLDDVLEAIIAAAERGPEGFAVYNIGSGRGTRVIDLVHLAEKLMGRESAIGTTDSFAGELSQMVADPARAERDLDWRPRHGLEAGLLNMTQ